MYKFAPVKIKKLTKQITNFLKTTIQFIFFITLFFLACTPDQPDYVFQISGKFPADNPEEIVLQFDEANTSKTILVADKKKSSFFIKSLDSLPVGLYFLKVGNNNLRIPLLIDNTDIVVKMNKKNLADSFTRGKSKYQKLYYNYRSGVYNAAKLFIYQKGFVLENKNSILGAIALKDMLGGTQWRLKQTLILYEQLDSSVQKSKLGKEIINYIQSGLDSKVEIIEYNTIENKPVENLEDKEKEISIVKVEVPVKNATPELEEIIPESGIPEIETAATEYAPYFYGYGLDGNEISAKAVFNKNKLTLIDFWASWCLPCRAQNPEFVSLYQKYHSKGFEILSIAEDKKETDWKRAITQDNMTWIHVNDDYRIANMYRVRAIPNAILVDSQGGILAKDVSAVDLKALLQRELGY